MTARVGVETARQQPESSGQEQDDLVDPALRARAKHAEELTKGLIGAWRLARFQPAAPELPPSQASGLMLVAENVLTIQLQIVPTSRTTELARPVVQSGAHYWRIGPLGTLELATVMAHDTSLGEVRFEQPLEPREYVVQITGNRLVLSKRDGARLEFDRFEVTSFPPRAIQFIEAMRAGRNLDDLRR